MEREISGGAMAIVAVILNNKLYIANVGVFLFFTRLILIFLRVAAALAE